LLSETVNSVMRLSVGVARIT